MVHTAQYGTFCAVPKSSQLSTANVPITILCVVWHSVWGCHKFLWQWNAKKMSSPRQKIGDVFYEPPGKSVNSYEYGDTNGWQHKCNVSRKRLSEKIAKHEGRMSRYMDIRHLCRWHWHLGLLWLLLTKITIDSNDLSIYLSIYLSI